MMYYTHLAFGLLTSIIYLHFFNIDYPLIFVLIAVFFSIFPDIDESRSKIGRKNKIFSIPIKFVFGHRDIFHTIYVPIILFAIIFNLSETIGIAMIIGYASHLLMDALTKHGIRPLSPLIRTRIYGFVKTNSVFEKLFFLLILALDLYFITQYAMTYIL